MVPTDKMGSRTTQPRFRQGIPECFNICRVIGKAKIVIATKRKQSLAIGC